MYYCKNCGLFFDEPVRTDNTVPYAGTYVYEYTTEECPHCYSDDITDDEEEFEEEEYE